MIKKIFIFFSIFTLFVGNNNVYAKDNKFKADARCAIAMERQSKTILFEQNAYEIVPMASTTKILTALIAIEEGNLDKEVLITKNASCVRGSKVGYKCGEYIKLKELVYGLMFRSGNDAAIAIAEDMGGSIEGFSEMMNHYARSIGILDSHFQSPHGLDSSRHYSSAYDLALLTCKAMELPLFREIVGSKTILKDKYDFSRDYNNINKILWMIPEANGVKTGYTGAAGRCLVSSIKNNDKDIIIVVLNCPERWSVTQKIYENIKDNIAFEGINIKKLI